MGFIDDNGYRPQNGRYLAEDGTEVNFADIEQFRHQYDVVNQIVNNGAILFTCRFNIASQGTVFIVLDPAAGKKVSLFHRDLALTEGKYYTDVVKVSSYGSEQQPTNKAVNTMNVLNSVTFTSSFFVDAASVVVSNVLEYGLVDSGTSSGNRVAAGVVGNSEIYKIYSGEPVALRVSKQNVGTGEGVLNLVLWEEDI